MRIPLLSLFLFTFSLTSGSFVSFDSHASEIEKVLPVAEQEHVGPLVIIGGGQIPKSILNKIVALSGGAQSRLIIVPLASSIPVEVALDTKKMFQDHGAVQTEVFQCKAEAMDTPICLKQLSSATGVFFTGGDQNKLAQAFAQTQAFKEVLAIHQRGGVLAGTSAGAAIMSQIMLTGDEKPETNHQTIKQPLPFSTIQKQRVITSAGFGLVSRYIIDQHFIKRQRQNRLMSVVLDHPQRIGIGIDESTAILVHPDQSFEVLGDASVLVIDARQASISNDGHQNYSTRNLLMHLLTVGQVYP